MFPASKPPSSTQELLARPTPRRKSLLAEVLAPVAECSIAVPELHDPFSALKLDQAEPFPKNPPHAATHKKESSRPRKAPHAPERDTIRAALLPEKLPKLLTVQEAGLLLRASPKAVYAMNSRGQLPGVMRRGRRVLFRRDDLLAFIVEGRALSSGRNRR